MSNPVIIDKINEHYRMVFTEMDKVQLFEKDFPNMAANRHEQNEAFLGYQSAIRPPGSTIRPRTVCPGAFHVMMWAGSKDV